MTTQLEQQVVSLELAQKMKTLGAPQESLFYWCSFDPKGKSDWRGPYVVDDFEYDEGEDERWLRYPDGGQHTFRKNFDCGDTASAFTVAELGSLLAEWQSEQSQDYFKSVWNGGSWDCYLVGIVEDREELIAENMDSEADARAKCWIYLKENNLI